VTFCSIALGPFGLQACQTHRLQNQKTYHHISIAYAENISKLKTDSDTLITLHKLFFNSNKGTVRVLAAGPVWLTHGLWLRGY
jgi:hypothetical protein